ncbi:DUF397 domain-containing protein [Nonomuraea sp. NPDC050383]|uniref:DUF397 domain-containing protein n=1 Tax=Nonomuraea sp. NPDC050383 TaxID=3364362 RepID=UPI00378F306E
MRMNLACSSSVKPCSGEISVRKGNGALLFIEEKMQINISVNPWRKSSFCSSNSCVEVAPLGDGSVALRDGKVQDGPVLVFTSAEWEAFVAGVREGEFDVDALAPRV